MLVRLKLCFGALLMLSFLTAQDVSTSWDHEIEVQHGPEKFDRETLYAYSTIAYEVGRGDVKRLILEEVKEVTNEKATKKAIKNGIKVHLPKFDGDEISARAKTEEVDGGNAVRVVVAFLKGDDAINPEDYPAGHDAAQGVMRNLGLILNRAVVEEQVRESKEELEDLQKKRQSLLKDKDDLEQDILDARQEIVKRETDNEKLKKKMAKAQANAASLEVLANASSAEAKDMKKYASAQSKASKIESKVLKNNQKIVAAEADRASAEQEQPLVDQQLQELEVSIQAQSDLVSKLEAKLEAIQ